MDEIVFSNFEETDAEMGEKGSWEFIGIAGAGLLVNLIGTIVFAGSIPYHS